MKVLFAIILFVVVEATLPIHVRLRFHKYFPMSLSDLYRKFKLVSFPRTIFAVCTCIAIGLDYFVPVSAMVALYVCMVFWLLYVASAFVDLRRIYKAAAVSAAQN